MLVDVKLVPKYEKLADVALLTFSCRLNTLVALLYNDFLKFFKKTLKLNGFQLTNILTIKGQVLCNNCCILDL
jgi:hypothetical protein